MPKPKTTLTRDRLKELFHYDPETGLFTRKVRTAQCTAVGEVAGFVNAQGYIGMKVDGERHVAHRLAWLYVHGYFPPNDLDHRDTVRHHNWISNLRLATRSENRQNTRAARSDSKTGLIGVVTKAKSWQARIQANGKSVHLGTFSTPEQAHSAYLSAKARLHPFQTLVERSD